MWNRRLFLVVALSWLTILLAAQPARAQPQQLQQPPRVPNSVELRADLPYAGTDNPRQMLDLVLPRKRGDEPLPVVVFVHGGAWRHGHKNSGVRRLAKLVSTGKYAGVSVGYRLTDEAQWPAQIHDCKAAIRWIRANAGEYDLDAERIGVWGSSAGGHLVAMLGTSGDVSNMDGALGPHAEISSRVHCVVDFYGPTDLLRMSEMALPEATFNHDGTDSPESKLLGSPLQESPEKAASANPNHYVTKDDPPMLIVHGTRDLIVPFGQSQLLHNALQQVGAPSTLITVAGGSHGNNFGPEVVDLVTEFFAHHLLGQKIKWQDQTVPAAEKR